MRRRLLVRVLALISVAPSLAAAAMWVRSFWIRDAFPESLHESGCSIRSWNGRVFILLIKVAKQPGLVVSITTPGIAGCNLSAKKVQIRLMPYASQRRRMSPIRFRFPRSSGRLPHRFRGIVRDGINWSPAQIVIDPDHVRGDPWDEQFYGMQVFRYHGFWLGLLHTYHVQSQTIAPEWAWSHNGINWARTRTPCIPLGDEGRFDSRMILFGSVVVTDQEIIWLYSGYDWRHNAFKKGEVSSAIGRAVLPRQELDAWLSSLPNP